MKRNKMKGKKRREYEDWDPEEKSTGARPPAKKIQ